jgi:predicted MPP superfamily phosphohydrolase
MRFILFAAIFLSVFALLSFYVSRRLIRRLDFQPKTKKALNWFLVLNFMGIILYMLGRYQISVPNSLYFLFSLPIGILFLLFITTLLYEFFHYALKKVPLKENRREFFKKSLDISAVGLASGFTAKAMFNAKTPQLEMVEVFIKDLKQEYIIVQLSDVHIGGIIEKNFIASLVQQVNVLKPDLVVITGDLIDSSVSNVKEAVDELSSLNSAFGTFFVPGNHEYFHNVQEIMSYLENIGIHVLHNNNVYIGLDNQGFNLAGVYDVFGYRYDAFKPDINKALQGTSNSPTVLLAHQPKFIEEVKDVDLMLSGHTHGGQIMPFNFLVKLAQPYVKGLHQHNERTQIYVNKGTGFWGPPMRLGASAEITHLTLKPSV